MSALTLAMKRYMGHPQVNWMQEGEIFRALRKLAREAGFNVKKRGAGYQLFQGDMVVAGEKHPLEIKELAREMQRRHIIGWEGTTGESPRDILPHSVRG